MAFPALVVTLIRPRIMLQMFLVLFISTVGGEIYRTRVLKPISADWDELMKLVCEHMQCIVQVKK